MSTQANPGTMRADVFATDGADFTSPAVGFSIDGGNSIDEISLQGTGTVTISNLVSVADSVEIINTGGGGDITLSAISAADVTALSDLSTRNILTANNAELLIMQGDRGEVVALDSGWTLLTGTSDNGILQYGGADYNLFSNGTAVIAIAEGRSVTVNGMATPNAQVTIDMSDDNIIIGGDGNDRLTGGSGDDFIYGGNGNDTLISGGGLNHVFAGGAGRDIFYNNSLTDGSGTSIILDFERGVDRFAVASRTDLREILRNDPQATSLTNSQIDQLVNQFIRENSAVDFFEELFNLNGVYTPSIASETVFGGTDTVSALQLTTTAGTYTYGAMFNGQRITATDTLDASVTTIIPTAEYSNIADLQDGSITFADVVAAAGGESAFIYI